MKLLIKSSLLASALLASSVAFAGSALTGNAVYIASGKVSNPTQVVQDPESMMRIIDNYNTKEISIFTTTQAGGFLGLYYCQTNAKNLNAATEVGSDEFVIDGNEISNIKYFANSLFFADFPAAKVRAEYTDAKGDVVKKTILTCNIAK